MKKIIIILVTLLMCLNVNAYGEFTAIFDTDFYFAGNMTNKVSDTSAGNIAHLDSIIQGTPVNSTHLIVTGYVTMTVLNGTSFTPFLKYPYINGFSLTGTTGRYDFVAGTGGGVKVWGYMNHIAGTSQGLPLNLTTTVITANSVTFNIGSYTSEIQVDPTPQFNSTSPFTLSLGFVNDTRNDGLGNIPWKAPITADGAVHQQVEETGGNSFLNFNNDVDTAWFSGLTTTTTTTSTTTTIVPVNNVDINVSVDLSGSGDDITDYILYIWDCGDISEQEISHYQEFSFEERDDYCDLERNSSHFSNTSKIETGLTGDQFYLIECRRNKDNLGFAIVNPAEYVEDELVNVSIKITYDNNVFYAGFFSTLDGDTLLSGVEYRLYDGNLLLLQGNSSGGDILTPASWEAYYSGKTNLLLQWEAIKTGYMPVNKGSQSSNVETGLFGKILLKPINNSFNSVSGYVNDVTGDSVDNIKVRVSGDNGYDYDGTTNTTGFYNITGVAQYIRADVYSQAPSKVNGLAHIIMENADLNDINLTISGSSYNTTLNIIVQKEYIDNIFVPVFNCGVKVTSICGTSETYERRTNGNGMVTLGVKESECEYKITANYDDVLSDYKKISITKLSSDKTPAYIILPFKEDQKTLCKFWCYEDNEPANNISITLTVDNVIWDQSYTDSDGGKLFNVIPYSTVEITCDAGDGRTITKSVLACGSDNDDGSSGGDDGDDSDGGDDGSGGRRLDIGDTDDSSMLDGLWTTVTDASTYLEWLLVIILMTFGLKVGKGFVNEIGGK